MLQTKFYLSNEYIAEPTADDSSLALDENVRIYDFDIVMPGETTKQY